MKKKRENKVEMEKNTKRVAVIGAGPAGLTVAYELLKRSSEFDITIFEKEKVVGGLSKTVSFAGNRVDIGGHRYFTKDKKILEIWKSVMSKNNDCFLKVVRKSHILYHDCVFQYPIKIDKQCVKQFGLIKGMHVINSFLYSHFTRKDVVTLEDYYIKQFGKKLYDLFFKDYTYKVWGINAKEMSADWGRQRVQEISLKTILHKKLFRKESAKKYRSLIDEFYYPRMGAGLLWENMANCINDMGGKIKANTVVQSIFIDNKKYVLTLEQNENKWKDVYDIVISSMPLNELIFSMKDVDEPVSSVAKELCYRNMIVVAFEITPQQAGDTLLNNSEDCWLYIQDNTMKAGRIQILNNWSKDMVKNEKNYVVEIEYFCDLGDALWNLEEEQMKRLAFSEMVQLKIIRKDTQIVYDLVQKIDKAYPIYSSGYYEVEKIQKWINGHANLFCIGRNGQHHYNNMDHSMQTALNVADYLLGESIDKEQIWNVNMDSKYQEEI